MWRDIGTESARAENERIEKRRNAHYAAKIVSDPIREMHETLRDIQSLLAELMEEIKKRNTSS